MIKERLGDYATDGVYATYNNGVLTLSVEGWDVREKHIDLNAGALARLLDMLDRVHKRKSKNRSK